MPDDAADFPPAEGGDPRDRFKQAVANKQANGVDAEDHLWSGSYSHLAMLGTWIGGAVATVAAVVVAGLANTSANGWFAVLLGIGLMWLALAAWYGYRRLSVHYKLSTQRFVHESGLLWRTVDRVELIDVDDITYRQGPVERMLGVGTIVISSSDRTSPELHLPGIENVATVADAIDDARRTERRTRGLHIESV
ncbi:Bacterial membrane flanked domain protein [Botrimarina colliarenosi]|uniref:Bacterial membrane flanked domain protein n=1 Tax=Botrimarina colliarenosi TaxID=2528001 RepID=A0A5C6ALJ9_9BACT|nr:PH domain-containing protein [Botrimarina colliarenosi]TWU00056.1 Bacterial membrane flanked domain protein [Botrimarina colliarenosi]